VLFGKVEALSEMCITFNADYYLVSW
jgi:hypothetical protein